MCQPTPAAVIQLEVVLPVVITEGSKLEVPNIRRTLMLLAIAGLLVCSQVSRAQSVALCTPVDGPNGSRLCVNLAFQDGKLVVDRNSSKLNASAQFAQNLIHLTPDQAKTTFFDQLDQKLANRKKPYQLALAPGEPAKDAAGQLNDPLTVELRAFSGSFQAYRVKFTAWSKDVPDRQTFVDIFGENATTGDGLYAPLTTVDTDLGLIFNDNSEDVGFNLATATFSFTVIDPVKDWSGVNIDLPGVSDPAKKAARLKRIRERLAPLRGQIWNPHAITAAITRYYRQLDLVPSVTVSSVTNGLSITIVEASRIARIILPPQGDSNFSDYLTDMEKILYVLMADHDFRTFIKNRGTMIPATISANAGNPPTNTTRPVIDYQVNLNHDGPYLDASRIQVQQLLLSQIGYLASIQDAEGSTLTGLNVVLDVQKIAETPATPAGTAKPAPATANPTNVVTGHQQEANPATDFVAKNSPETEPPAKPLKEKKNYIGGGFEYRPGQGIRIFGLGQRSQLNFPFQNASISATGGANGGGIGSVNYFADYVGFGRLHRRVSLQFSGGSDSDPNRVISGQTMDQRNTGGSARIEFEPFRDRNGSLLRFYAEGRQTLVTLSNDTNATARQHLTTLDLGSLFTFASVEAEYPRRLRLEPMVRFGLGLAVGAPSFTKLTLTGNFHQALPHRMAADVSGSLALASRNTPMFELPSFGGPEVVRGFRRDDALGRRLWSLQNELWLPLPNTSADDDAGLKTFLRDNVRLAPFVDVGGLYSPNTSKAGVRSGYGLGLRVIYNIIILKVDYGYGVGPAATSGSRGKFYFSVGSNLPF